MSSLRQHAPSMTRRLAAACAALPLLAACGTSTSPSESRTSEASPRSSAAPDPGSGEREVAAVSPRVLVAGEGGGLTLLDADTGKTVDREKLPGFIRLSQAGDGRRVMVVAGSSFRVYDTGIEEQPHGDHGHAYEYEPGLTEVSYRAPHPGHVVPHAGKTVLFGDGDGSIQIIPTEQIGSTVAPVEKLKTDDPHHGVALTLGDGTLLTTQGTEDERTTVEARQGDKVVTKTTACPGVHGETTAADDAVLFGCEDGPVIYRDGKFHKVKAPDAYARTGNVAGTHESPVVLTDYKTDEEAELERPTRVALVDTRTDKLKLVELDSSYWFRSLARGPEGEALVLTYDGKLNVIDATSGEITERIAAISPWKEKDDWQDPGPAVQVAGHTAYVTDAAKKQLVVIDLKTGEVTKRHDLPKAPVEIAVTTGTAPDPHEHGSEESHGEEDHESGSHEGHDH